MARYISIACIVLFAALTLTYLSSADKVQTDQLEPVANEDQLQRIRTEHTPGLKLAEELGLTRSFEQRYEIPGTDYTLQFDKVWYNSEYIYFFYNIDFGDEPVTNGEVPSLQFRVSVADQDSMRDQGTFTKSWAPENGLVLENRYYHRVMTHALKDEKFETLTEVDAIRLTQIEVKIGEQVYHLPSNIILEVDFDARDEQEIHIPLDDQVQFADHNLHFTKLVLGTAKNVLYFRFEPGSDPFQLSDLVAELRSGNGEVRTLAPAFVRMIDDGTYIAQFDPFDSWPESVQLQLDALHLISEEGFRYRLNTSEWPPPLENADRVEWELKELIDSFYDTDIYLEKLVVNDEGVYVQIRYDSGKRKEGAWLYASSLQDRLWYEDGSWDGGMLLEVVNDSGQRAEIEKRDHDENGYGFLLPMDFVTESEWIEFSVDRLMVEVSDSQMLEWDIRR